jgi:hypothetical protein
MRHVTDRERRARLATRHALALGSRVASPEDAARAVVALHATDPPSIPLSIWARTSGVSPEDVDRALSIDRTLMKQLAMRRTLFVFPRELLPAVMPSAAARVAAAERGRMARDLVRAGVTDDGTGWLDAARDEAVAALRMAGALSAAELRAAVPRIDVTVSGTGAERWSAPQVLTLLGASGEILRGPSSGSFPLARPLWTLPASWLVAPLEPRTAAEGYRELVERWLRAFGPGTESDIVWWLGATKGIVRQALASLEAVPVSLDGGTTGWLLPDDVGDVRDADSWTALLPPLDPTVMGWKSRDFYLGPHHASLFDSRGNAGTTAWADGRIVGCWTQDVEGAVRVHLLEDVAPSVSRALDEQADRLTEWVGSARLPTGYRSPAMRAAL